MADIVLKDRNGNNIEYPGVNHIKVKTTDGVTRDFVDSETVPEVVENYPVVPDFSNGDQILIAPDGYVVKSAIYKKPENLIPENIPEGMNIAGIVGSLAAGGNVKCETVTVNYTDVKTGITTMHHNLGVVPDIIVMKRLGNNIKGCINYAIGFSRAFADLTGIDPVSYAEYRSTSNQTTPVILAGFNSSGACFDESAARVGFHSVTSTEFSIGSTVIGLSNSFDYTFYLIGGLT